MILAIDIGGTKIAMANIANGVCIDRRQAPMPTDEGAFLSCLQALAAGRPPPSHAAVAVTGCFDGARVRGINRNTIAFWQDYPLTERLQKLLGYPVMAINDAQAAAWGEFAIRDDNFSNLLFITLSTGVGAGLVLDGRLQVGTHGLAGHLGHSSVDVVAMDAPVLCGCGRQNCLETVASGTALSRQASLMFGRQVSSQELFEMTNNGNVEAVRLVDRAAAAVASAIANTHVSVDLQRVVLGGSVGLAPSMTARIDIALKQLPSLYHVQIEGARLGPDAGLIGASAWFSRADNGTSNHG